MGKIETTKQDKNEKRRFILKHVFGYSSPAIILGSFFYIANVLELERLSELSISLFGYISTVVAWVVIGYILGILMWKKQLKQRNNKSE